MKIVVDKMPTWRGVCPFAEENWERRELDYKCRLNGCRCDLDDSRKCHMLMTFEEVKNTRWIGYEIKEV